MALTILEIRLFRSLEKDFPQVCFATKFFFLSFLSFFFGRPNGVALADLERYTGASLYLGHPSSCIPQNWEAMMDVDGNVNIQ